MSINQIGGKYFSAIAASSNLPLEGERTIAISPSGRELERGLERRGEREIARVFTVVVFR